MRSLWVWPIAVCSRPLRETQNSPGPAPHREHAHVSGRPIRCLALARCQLLSIVAVRPEFAGDLFNVAFHQTAIDVLRVVLDRLDQFVGKHDVALH